LVRDRQYSQWIAEFRQGDALRLAALEAFDSIFHASAMTMLKNPRAGACLGTPLHLTTLIIEALVAERQAARKRRAFSGRPTDSRIQLCGRGKFLEDSRDRNPLETQ